MGMRTATTVKRGIPLTILLVVLTVMQLAGTVSLVITWYSRVTHNQSGAGLLLTGAVLGIVALVAYAGIWLWRRWGVYLLAVVAVIGVVSDAVFGLPSWQLLVRLALLAALAYFIRLRWASFR